MTRRYRPWLSAVAILIATGCGKPTGTETVAEKDAAPNLRLFGIGYQSYLDQNSRPPRNWDELKTVISSDQPIDFARYHMVWGVDLRAPTPSRAVLAYDLDVPGKGGMVLFTDGKVERVSAEEFGKLPQAAAPKPLADRPVDATFTPNEYYAEFKKLGPGMGHQYRGKVVELKGVSAGLGLIGKPGLLVISPGKDQEEVRCFMAGDKEFWAKVAKGQEVTVRGLVGDSLDSPVLIECVITAAGRSTAVTTTAPDLAKDVAAGWEKAEAKYKGKSVILTGEVISVEPRGSFLCVKLQGTKGHPVECLFYSNDLTKERDKTFVPGAKLRLYGESGPDLKLENCQLITG